MANRNSPLFFKRLEHAPFPYDSKFADSERDFFDHVDPDTGVRLHTTPAGKHLSENSHYWDSHVLFFIPTGFNPWRPFFYLVFFHGFGTTAAQTVKDFRIVDQVTASKRNVILITPQLAVDAADSSPGKFFIKDVFKDFMAEAAHVLSEKVGHTHSVRLAAAPIILSAFSGGYKSVAYVLDRGGVSERIRGIYLLDALYDDLEMFSRWIEKNHDKAFFELIYSKGPVKKNAKRLAAQLVEKGIGHEKGRSSRLTPGRIYLTPSDHVHATIPLFGPPMHPLKQMLESLWF